MTELMTFKEHIKEFQHIIIILGIVFIVGILLNTGLSIIILKYAVQYYQLVSIEPLDIFNSSILVSFVMTILLCFPLAIWLLLKYLKPAFAEFGSIKSIFMTTIPLFYIGFFFGSLYFSIIMMYITKQYADILHIQTMWSILSFTKFVLLNGLIFAAIFQFPLILYYGLKTGFIDAVKIKKNSWIAVPVIFIMSGWITPPDPISLFIVAIPISLLYYFSLYGSLFINNRRMIKCQSVQ